MVRRYAQNVNLTITQTADSENNIFGRTLNPHNTILTAGGSSGGKGALVPFRGSISGVGTDIAGSIRIPALCCGVYGFKPTVDRIPFGGQVSGAVKGIPGLDPVAGPLAHSIADLKLQMSSVVADGQAWKYDSAAVGVPWQTTPSGINASESFTIGMLADDEHFPLNPPVKRALDRAVEALTRAGYLSSELVVAMKHRVWHMRRVLHFSISTLARTRLLLGPAAIQQGLGPFETILELRVTRQRVHEA